MCVFFLALVHPLYLYLLRASLVISCPLSQDSKCTVPDATTAAVAAMTTGLSGSEKTLGFRCFPHRIARGPQKHIVFSDSCSAACEAVNDALRHFQVLQAGPQGFQGLGEPVAMSLVSPLPVRSVPAAFR